LDLVEGRRRWRASRRIKPTISLTLPYKAGEGTSGLEIKPRVCNPPHVRYGPLDIFLRGRGSQRGYRRCTLKADKKFLIPQGKAESSGGGKAWIRPSRNWKGFDDETMGIDTKELA